jgi:hypothetical protein
MQPTYTETADAFREKIQFQRNIVGEMVLGLPKEPRTDAGPWNEAPR